MDGKQTYTRKSNARRAALADFGDKAVEGRDYTISCLANGRYLYKQSNALSGLDGRDKYGFRLGTKASKPAFPK